MKSIKIPSVELNNGVRIPMVGLGTFPMKRELSYVAWRAIRAGYTRFDTAAAYKNEQYLSLVLKFFVRRKNIFVTSKLSNGGQRTGDVRGQLVASLRRLRMKYLDLYLMHWPNPGTFQDSWKQMEVLQKEGLVRAIGVCNFHQHHMEELLRVADIVPAVNQIELHPLLSQKPLVDYCRSLGVVIESYSPLARMDPKLINHKCLNVLAAQHQRTVPQIIFRWIIQSGHLTCPKTSNPYRLRENINLFDFELSPEEMACIDELNEDYRVRHNPDTCDFTKL